MKILHISDLHFCAPATEGVVAELLDVAERLFQPLSAFGFEKVDLEISHPDPNVLDKLRDFALATDPDILAVTGDITTFGDTESFEQAKEWLKNLLTRANGDIRTCVLVPGNHDLLAHQLGALLSTGRSLLARLHRAKRLLLTGIFHQQARTLSRFASNPIFSSHRNSDPFLEFRKFAESDGAFVTESHIFPLDPKDTSRVVLLPFCTVSSDPFWMNSGVARANEWDALNKRLADPRVRRPGSLRIVLAHHNPISSPGRIEDRSKHAYNSMPGGTDFLRVLQENGVDILLHGHQHCPAVYSFDFDLKNAGHAFGIGSPSSSSAKEAGCNVLEIADVNHVSLEQYEYDNRAGFRQKGEAIDLALERNCPRDRLTTAARLEIKRYSYGEEAGDESVIWSRLHGPGTELVYMSGRRFREVRENAFEPLSRLLEGNVGRRDGQKDARLRILLTDPDLLDGLATQGADLLGKKENLVNLAGEARRTRDELLGFVSRRSANERQRIDVRASHTLLPFAAYVRDADKPWGKMAIKVLPIGIIKEIDSPVLVIHRRREFAMYSFYLTYLKYLFLRGRSIAGEWNSGDADLQQGLDPAVFAA